MDNKKDIEKIIGIIGIQKLIDIAVPIIDLYLPVQYSPNGEYDNRYFFICLLDFTCNRVSWRKYKGSITHPINGVYLNQIHNKYVKNGIYEKIFEQVLSKYLKNNKEKKLKYQIIDSSFVANKGGMINKNNHLLTDHMKEKNNKIIEKNKNLPKNKRKRPHSLIDFNKYNGRT